MFPVTLALRGRRCLVVGAGGVALRKVQALYDEGAIVTVVAPHAVEPLEEMARRDEILWHRRGYRQGEAAHYRLVFAATDCREVNQQVYEDAEAHGVWANVADEPEICSFHLTGRVRRGDLELTIGSGGGAPFVVRRLRQLLEQRIGPEWAEWLEAAARFRDDVRERVPDPADQEACFERFFAGTVDADRLTARVPTGAEREGWIVAATEEAQAGKAPAGGARRRGRQGEGLVSLVGAGPGAADLLTLRARDRLLAADAVVYDRLAATVLPCDIPARVALHPVGKTAGHHPVPQEEINALLVRLGQDGKRVVRLKGGDPYVFGRGGEEAEALAAAGVPFEVISGVTSGIAAPAWAGIPVTHRGASVRVTLVTGHECTKSEGPQVRWDLLAQDPHSTLVGYMGVSGLPAITEQLIAAGLSPETPAALIERGTVAAQRTVRSTVGRLVEDVAAAGLKPPALFVIGPTAGLTNGLDWYGQLPLAGERLVVPAARAAMAAALRDAGAEVIPTPIPVTPAARVVMDALPLTGCVVGEPAEVDALDELRAGRGWSGAWTAWSIGAGAAERARLRGWTRIEEVAEEASGAELVARIEEVRACPA
jgi:uroporphyrin-III C-methyltransferase/precorrin-2 dehydrogenase/sirohydrochlorin ferrochelatase